MFTANYYTAIQTTFSLNDPRNLNQIAGVNLIDPTGTARSPWWAVAEIFHTSSYTFVRGGLGLLYPYGTGCTLMTTYDSTLTRNSHFAWKIAFGDGDQTPTLSDYALSGNLLTTISVLTWQTAREVANGVSTYTVKMAVQNTGTESVSIKEIGSFYPLMAGEGQNSESCWYLMERTLLDNPITIDAGNSGTVIFTVSQEFPTMPV